MTLDPKFNKLPKVTDFGKASAVFQQTHEEGFRTLTGQELVSEIKDYIEITGVELAPISSGALDTPSNQEIRTMEVVGVGPWTHPTLPGGSVSMTSVQKGKLYWDKTKWSLRNVVDFTVGAIELAPIAGGALPTITTVGQDYKMQISGGLNGATFTDPTLPGGKVDLAADEIGVLWFDGKTRKWSLENKQELPSSPIANEDGDSEDVAASQALASSKVSKEEGKTLAPEKAVKTIENNETISSPEWLEVKVDSKGNILEGTKTDGTKYFSKGVPTELQVKNIEKKTDIIESTNLGIWIYVIADVLGNVLFGIKKDGSITAKGLEVDLSNITAELSNKANQIEVDRSIKQLSDSINSQLNATNLVVNALSDNIIVIDTSVSNKLTELEEVLNNINTYLAFKGFFLLESELPPTGIKEGSFAYVGDNLSVATVYRVNSSLTWVNTGTSIPTMNVDLNSYATKEYVNDLVNGNDFDRNEVNAIYIKNQSDYDNINASIANVLDTKEPLEVFSINILFENGLFKFNDTNTIFLYQKNFINAELNISAKSGNNPIIIGEGDEYTPDDLIATTPTHYKCQLKDVFNVNTIFLNEDFKVVEQFDTGLLNPIIKIHQATSNVTVVNSDTRIAKFKLPEELNFIKNKDSNFFKNSLLYYTSWFIHKHCKVNYTDNEYIYFTYDRDYHVDGDFTYKGTFPCFWISNIPNCYLGNYITVDGDNIYIPKNVKKLYSVKYNRLFQSSENKFKKINITSLKILGSSLFNLNNIDDTRALINIYNTDNVNVDYNVFENIGNTYVVKNDCAKYDYDNCGSNYFSTSFNRCKNIYGALVRSAANYSKHNFNVVEESSKLFKFYPTVQTDGKGCEIMFNVFSDFAYGGIRVGGERVATRNCSAVVKCNILFMTNDYRKYLDRNTTMDAGAIYIFTHQDYTIVESNIIFDYEGRYDYRGIFCDDGMYRTTLRNNLIYRVSHFTIDARRVANPSTIHPTNTENIVEYNILFGRYRYQGNPNFPNSCISRRNILAFDQSDLITNDVISNIKQEAVNIIDSKSRAYDKVFLTKSIINQIPNSKFILQHINYLK